MAQVLRILHLSDLHQRVVHKGTSKEQQMAVRLSDDDRYRVLGKKSDFGKIIKDFVRQNGLDLVCFTGDIADWGLEDEYKKATEFLERLIGITGLDKKRFYFVPGNHDIDRSTHKIIWKKLKKLCRESSDEVCDWMVGGKKPARAQKQWRAGVLKRQSAFWDFIANDWGRPKLLPKNHGYGNLGYRCLLDDFDIPVHIIGLDSAWLCGEDDEANTIHLAEAQIKLLTRDTDSDTLPGFRLALVHHPLEELADQHPCFNLLADRVDLLLHGHIHNATFTLLNTPDRNLRVIAAGSLFEGGEGVKYFNQFQFIEVRLDPHGKPNRYKVHYYNWSPPAGGGGGGHWFRSGQHYKEARDGILTIVRENSGHWAVQSRETEKRLQGLRENIRRIEKLPPHPAVVERPEHWKKLRAALLNTGDNARTAVVCGVHGMAGVGKTFLVDEFFAHHLHSFPGKMMRYVFDEKLTPEADDIIAIFAETSKIPWLGAKDDRRLVNVLKINPPLIHLENVDSEPIARVAVSVAQRLKGVPVVISGRANAYSGSDLPCLSIQPFDREDALKQLRREVRPEIFQALEKSEAAIASAQLLVDTVGGLPLAIHFAAGNLNAGRTAQSLIDQLRRKGLSLQSLNVDDDGYRERALNTLEETFQISFDSLPLALTTLNPSLEAVNFSAMGLAPRVGCGPELAAAIMGLDQSLAEQTLVAARSLSLIDMGYTGADSDIVWRLHPLVKSFLASKLNQAAVESIVKRIISWIAAQLADDDMDTRLARWTLAAKEQAALLQLLESFPTDILRPIVLHSASYVDSHGPYLFWVALAQACEAGASPEEMARLAALICRWARHAGDLEKSEQYARKMKTLTEELEDRQGSASAMGAIARIKVDKGEVDAALKLLEEMLAVFEALGDRRSRAVTLGDIARIKVDKGDVDDALKLHEERRAVFQNLDDQDGIANTLWDMAQINIEKQDFQKAFERLSKSYRINTKLGRLDGICVVGVDLGQLLCAGGHKEEGVKILKRSRDGFIQLGQQQRAEQISRMIDRMGE